MDCYKLIVTEDRFSSSSSRIVMIKLMREICKELKKKPNSEIGVMYIETNIFPKEYYFITSNNAILSKIKSSYKLEQTNYPPNLAEGTMNFKYLGNETFFTSKL